MFSIRGATTIEFDTKEEIHGAVHELLLKIIEVNGINIDDIISIIFTCTDDLKAAYPAEEARNMGIIHAGLLCLCEMSVENSLRKCIRVLMMVNGDITQKDVKHIYLRNAIHLRRDILQEF